MSNLREITIVTNGTVTGWLNGDMNCRSHYHVTQASQDRLQYLLWRNPNHVTIGFTVADLIVSIFHKPNGEEAGG